MQIPPNLGQGGPEALQGCSDGDFRVLDAEGSYARCLETASFLIFIFISCFFFFFFLFFSSVERRKKMVKMLFIGRNYLI